jgi:hypothetical protein
MGLGNIVGSILGTDDGSGQAAAAAEANRVSREQYEQMRNDLSGYRGLGDIGVDQVKNNLADLTGTFSMDKFQKDPGYDFRMQEGQKALERSASARGGLLGGGTLKALTQYGQDYASNEYGNAYNRFNQDRDQRYGKLMDLVGTGQNAANQTGAAGQNYAQSYGQNVMGGANALAAANNMGAQILAQGAGQAMGAYGMKSSDRRLKKNIERLETSKFKDVPTYSYEYKDESHGEGKQVGVMAQDLLELDPHHPAVGTRDGFYTVNYSMLEGA